ncbi:Holliday junction resolvase MOC1, chloroplastic-like [Punica granatum]|uniref:Uncharacterized protein n=2 Tax=Punica granatum TaxID=22663 RepID=A0A2I0L941_PUNGR|nr:Holliday junction resolvase MOC1, chloroplastic-like [Punica granatum]PKI77214.1 hypothetical protein CRG98_002424 [Punica granatum]
MESLGITPLRHRTQHMNTLCSRLRPKLPPASLRFRSLFCSCSLARELAEVAVSETQGTDNAAARKRSSGGSGNGRARVGDRVRVKVSDAQLKQNWIDSLSCPIADGGGDVSCGSGGLDWVLGIDPDVSGAVAVLKPSELGCTAQVFDSPFIPVLVGKKVRKRLDPKSIVQLLRSLDAPLGTRAYIEQSIPYPQDGKQGWWSGGFGYGLWIGILVTSGFSVVPVPSLLWKNGFDLSGSRSTKDDSRLLASKLFPSLSDQLKRKKDHGRAEALLIAAHGKGLKVEFDLPSISKN